MAFAADRHSQMGVDTRNGSRTDQIVEGRQPNRSVRKIQPGQVLRMAIRVARQHIKNLPAQQMLRIHGGIAADVLHQPVALGKGWTAELLIFFLIRFSARDPGL